MAPKNKKKTGFYFFMKEVQEKEAAKGCVIPMSSMAAYAHPMWREMSLAEKEPYEEMAKQYKNDPNLRGGKLASDGTRIEDNLLEEEEKKRKENQMIQNVKRYCNTDCATKDEFIETTPKKMFYFLSFNILCRTDEEEYIPIEVGLVEYSIQYGIHRQYAKILNPGPIPTGYTGEAIEHSKDKHQINVFGEVNSVRNMRVIYDEIQEFINPVASDEYPPLFCERAQLPITKGCLQWLSKITRRENVFEVWDATYLLMELRAGVGSPLPSYTIASDLLNKESFNYHPSTRCDFHEEKDLHFCALSYSKRLCYLLSDAVCNLFNVQLTDKHIPTRAVEEKSYTVTVFKETPTSPEVNPVRLDKTYTYYQNDQKEEENKSQIPKQSQPRQPVTNSLAESMNKLQLKMTAATVPGHGIGRGIRRK